MIIAKCVICGDEFRKLSSAITCSKICSCERHLQKQRKWYTTNSEKVKQRGRNWRAANPEKVRQRKRNWRAANPEKEKQTKRDWYAANPEKGRQNSLDWRAVNREKARQNVRNWRARAESPLYQSKQTKQNLKTLEILSNAIDSLKTKKKKK
jgi:hypothetical protein